MKGNIRCRDCETDYDLHFDLGYNHWHVSWKTATVCQDYNNDNASAADENDDDVNHNQDDYKFVAAVVDDAYVFDADDYDNYDDVNYNIQNDS